MSGALTTPPRRARAAGKRRPAQAGGADWRAAERTLCSDISGMAWTSRMHGLRLTKVLSSRGSESNPWWYTGSVD